MDRAMRWISTSVSLVVWKMEPASSNSRRSASAFTRLPLVAMARSPPRKRNTKGCAFCSLLAPAVE
ncbi:hypothetical protein D3C72_2237130 [compost metagenome]